MQHEHDFTADQNPTTYVDGKRTCVKSFCECGAFQRDIEKEDRYGDVRRTVLVTEPSGKEWESHAWKRLAKPTR